MNSSLDGVAFITNDDDDDDNVQIFPDHRTDLLNRHL